ncbi:MAG TPA: hypothetical protein VIL07_00215 [Symbiobacteriaceae bacterium]
MTTFRIALKELLRKTGVDDLDFLREGIRVLAQGLMMTGHDREFGVACCGEV